MGDHCARRPEAAVAEPDADGVAPRGQLRGDVVRDVERRACRTRSRPGESTWSPTLPPFRYSSYRPRPETYAVARRGLACQVEFLAQHAGRQGALFAEADLAPRRHAVRTEIFAATQVPFSFCADCQFWPVAIDERVTLRNSTRTVAIKPADVFARAFVALTATVFAPACTCCVMSKTSGMWTVPLPIGVPFSEELIGVVGANDDECSCNDAVGLDVKTGTEEACAGRC